LIRHYEHDLSVAFTYETGSRGMSVLVNADLVCAGRSALGHGGMRCGRMMRRSRIHHDAAFFGATASIEHYEVARIVIVVPLRPGAAVSLTRFRSRAGRLDDMRAAFDDAATGRLFPPTVCAAALFVDRRTTGQ